MPLLGTQWRNRDVMRLLWDNHWHDANVLMTMGATVFAESNNYDHAFHYNDPNELGDGSTDWGMFQLNDGNRGGASPDEHGNPQQGSNALKTVQQVLAFRDMAWDPYAAAPYARKLFIDRGFQPWNAYNNKAFEQYISQSCRAICNMLSILNGGQPLI